MKSTSAATRTGRQGECRNKTNFFTVSDFYRANLNACQKGAAAAAVCLRGYGEHFHLLLFAPAQTYSLVVEYELERPLLDFRT